jgi:3-dehydroquinate synthase
VTSAPKPLTISSAQGDYNVDFRATVDEAVREAAETRDAVFLIDRQVATLYAEPLAPILKGQPHLLLDATEEEKTLDGVGRVVCFLQQRNCTRQSVVVAIGGGIIQDLATFSSHIYYRGIRWVFVPTTLLSMSDSCIGAKCGINLGEFKNQLGVFQSPSRVIIATPFIDTLSDRDVASGYGEILKLMLTGSRGLFDKLRAATDSGGLRNPSLPELIRDSLVVKKRVIEEDEHETDLRRILNYGHTFAHALESLTEHEVPHGIAVAFGTDLVNSIAVSRGILDSVTAKEISEYIDRHFRFRTTRVITSTELLQRSRRDKKVADGEVNLILLEQPGSLKIVKTRFDERLAGEIDQYLDTHHALYRG